MDNLCKNYKSDGPILLLGNIVLYFVHKKFKKDYFMKTLGLSLLFATSLTSFAVSAKCSKPIGPVKLAFDSIENQADIETMRELLTSNLIAKTARNDKCHTLYHRSLGRSKNPEMRALLDELGYGPESVEEMNQDPEGLTISVYEFALINGSLETIKDLRARGGKISHPYQNELSWVSYRQSLDVVKYFINEGMDVNLLDNQGYTPLFLAAQGNTLDVVKLLVDSGANLHYKDLYDKSDALFFAITYNSNLDVTEYLAKQVNDIDSLRWRFTPLTAAALNKTPIEKMKILIQANANVNAKGMHGNTALMTASGTANEESVKLLLENGAYINAQNSEGFTALMRAVTSKKTKIFEVISLLIDAGADKKLKNKSGQTAYDIAKANNLDERVLNILKN
jgi:ankyrin repeat protein